MSRHPELYQWVDTVVTRFPSLSKQQALGLALWSFGMVIARSCSLTAVADVLAPLLGHIRNLYIYITQSSLNRPLWQIPVPNNNCIIVFGP